MNPRRAAPISVKFLVGALALTLGALVAALFVVVSRRGDTATAALATEEAAADGTERAPRAIRRAQPRALPPAFAPGAPVAEPPEGTPSPERSPQVMFKSLVDKHRQEPPNPGWARSTEQVFQVDLQQLAKKTDSSILEFECRSSSCVGRVEWSDDLQAHRTWSQYLHHSYAQKGCGSGILLDDEPTAGRRRGTLFFDCSADPQLAAR
jgi:hypothetical protein